MPSPELDGLIVEHLAEIDRAAARINDIESAVFTAMGNRAERWAEKHEWVADFSFPKSGWSYWESWVAPPGWRTAGTASNGNDFDARFVLEVGAGDTGEGLDGEDWHYLTRLCGVGIGQVGLRFKVAGVKPRVWKKTFPSLAEFVSETGFIADTVPSFFLPFAIEPGELAKALRDEDPDAALGPFESALNKLLTSKKAFDSVVQQLRGVAG